MENDSKISRLHPMIQNDVSLLINKAQTELGIKLFITSGYRSIEEQTKLKAQKGNYAATPGKSWHNYGLAIDIKVSVLSKNQLESVVQLAKSIGFKWGGDWKNIYEPWHFEKTFNLSISAVFALKKKGQFEAYPII